MRSKIAVVMAVAALTACGSTVQVDGALAGNAEGSLALPGETSLGTPDGSGELPGAMGTTGAQGGADPGDLATTGPGQTVPGAGGSSPTQPPAGGGGSASTHGVTEDTIKIGVGTQNDVSQLGESMGMAVDFGNPEAMVKAIVADINARGGVAGRKLEIVFHDVKSSDLLSDPNSASQAACAHWTQDEPVLAVVNAVAGINNETLYSCLGQRDTPLVIGDVGMHATGSMARHSGYIYAPDAPALERLIPDWLNESMAQGYFTGWNTTTGAAGPDPVKVGLLYGTRPADNKFFAQSVKSTLASQGVTLASTFEHSGDPGSMPREMSQAVLAFRDAGVTHVISDGYLLYFTLAAENQVYRPRYTVTSFHAPTLLADTASENQLEGILGVGYIPTLDVGGTRDPGDLSAAGTRCREVMKKAGQNPENRQALLVMVLLCDSFNFLAAAVDHGSPSTAGIRQGSASVKTIPPAATFTLAFPGGRPDGVAAVRRLSFAAACTCFTYTGGNHPM